ELRERSEPAEGGRGERSRSEPRGAKALGIHHISEPRGTGAEPATGAAGGTATEAGSGSESGTGRRERQRAEATSRALAKGVKEGAGPGSGSSALQSVHEL